MKLYEQNAGEAQPHELTGTVHFAANSTYAVENNVLTITDSRTDIPAPLKTRTYTAKGDNHTVAFGGWFTDEGCITPATEGTVGSAEVGLTLYAQAKSIDDFTSNINFEHETEGTPMYGSGTADIY